MIANLTRYLVHWARSRSAYGVHSPFAYEFVTQVLPHRRSEIGDRLETMRRKQARDKETRVEIRDLGAGYGGKARPHISKSMAEIVRSSARGRREGELLHRICRHYQPGVCLELGTNLGFSTAYQAAGVPGSTFITVEGAPELGRLARENVRQAGITTGLRFETGEFSEVLDRLLEEEGQRPDYVLLDGNHRYEPTMAYFERLLPNMPDRSMLVLDDVNWSAGMRRAWKEIVAHPEVSLSIDLFFMGIAFIRRPQEKQHFRFRFRP